jgi:hypothetical protein
MKSSAPPLTGIARDLHFLRTPSLWPTWPFLALVRRRPGQEIEFGVMYDFAGTSGRTGFGSTVFLSNLFLMPQNEDEMILQPREVFDNADEIVAADWRVD